METVVFENLGFLTHKFTDDELKPLRDEVEEIKNNIHTSAVKSRSSNNTLAGNMLYEFNITSDVMKYITELTVPCVFEYDKQFNYFKTASVLTEDVDIIVDKCWVNLQKKHEFNPPHNHTGVLSFVIYLDIPYNIEDEKKYGPGAQSNANYAGHFQFIYNNILGNTCCASIPTDNSYRNVMMLFPSKLFHCVQPFYTSDDYRISVAGNLYFNTK